MRVSRASTVGPVCNYLIAVWGNRFTIPDHYVRSAENRCITELGGRSDHPESVCASTPARAGAAPFIFPIRRVQECHVHPPDYYLPAGFYRAGRINQIADDAVPARVIVMGLNRPRAQTRFYLQGVVGRRRIRGSTAFQIGKALLRKIAVPGFFVYRERGKRPCCENTHQRAEHIGLLEIDVDKLLYFVLHGRNNPPNLAYGQAGRQGHTIVQPTAAGVWVSHL